jgi:hypothetical protein
VIDLHLDDDPVGSHVQAVGESHQSRHLRAPQLRRAKGHSTEFVLRVGGHTHRGVSSSLGPPPPTHNTHPEAQRAGREIESRRESLVAKVDIGAVSSYIFPGKAGARSTSCRTEDGGPIHRV